MAKITSWGRLNAFNHTAIALHDRTKLSLSIPPSIKGNKTGIAYGMGRSYGDVCINPDGVLWTTPSLNRYISFDIETGLLHCEAGVLLKDIQQLTIPHGWVLPVTPGTQIVTVGGAIANDVHGKNHHILGSFGDHVKQLTLHRSNGEIINCGPDHNQEWLYATIGGIGLTGIITDVILQLRRCNGPWLDAETIPYNNLDEFFELADNSEKSWEQTVSWIDGISSQSGRGIFMRSNPVDAGRLPLPHSKKLIVPFTPPFSLVNQLSLKPFNIMYFHLQKWLSGRKIVHYEPFSYPLDNILEWNRMYGPAGFYQYQSVVPRKNGKEATQEMLKAITDSGEGSFLAVLKTFGERNALGMMSFPQPGVTLAMDFPNKGSKTEKLFARLDAIVHEAEGRIYLAKDARMPKTLLEKGYPNLNEFLKYKDPLMSSLLSRRLIGC